MSKANAPAPRPRITPDKAVGAGLVAVGVLAALAGLAIDPDYDGSLTARIFPLMTSLALALMGALVMRGTPGPAKPDAQDTPGWRAPLAILAVAVGYLWLMGKLGYLLSTALAAPAALWVFGIRNRAGLVLSALLCPLAYHLIFFKLLGTYPPYGAWVDPLLALGW